MDKKILEIEISRGFSSWEIARELGVAQATIRYWLKKYGLKTSYARNGLKQTPEQRKASMVIAVKKRRKVLKAKAVSYLGGKCVRCGYSKCIGALEFHHRDPLEKDFGIASRGYTRSWEKVKAELDKCDLLCANCHREAHEDIDC